MFDLGLRAKPILKWAGGKSGSLSQLIPAFPGEFKRYLEPFVGGGAVFLSLKAKIPAILNDSNEDIIELYGVVRDRPAELMAQLDVLQEKYSPEFYYELRAAFPRTRIERAARLLFLNKTCFNGLYRLNSKGQFNVPFGKHPRCPTLYEKENILEVSQRLKNTILTSTDFGDVLDMARRGDFVYCDPPYESANTAPSFQKYTTQGFSRGEQKRLKDCCERAVERGAFVCVSSSRAKSILKIYDGYPINKIMAYRKINSRGSGRGVVPEVLITLVPRPKKPKAVRHFEAFQHILPTL